MKTWIASIALGLALIAGSAHAEDGAVSQDTLASFGLGGMKQMSDAQGKAVRGKFAVVYGSSTASFLGATAQHGYIAGGANGALGSSQSFAGLQANGSFLVGGIGGIGGIGGGVIGGGLIGGAFNNLTIGTQAGGGSFGFGF